MHRIIASSLSLAQPSSSNNELHLRIWRAGLGAHRENWSNPFWFTDVVAFVQTVKKAVRVFLAY